MESIVGTLLGVLLGVWLTRYLSKDDDKKHLFRELFAKRWVLNAKGDKKTELQSHFFNLLNSISITFQGSKKIKEINEALKNYRDEKSREKSRENFKKLFRLLADDLKMFKNIDDEIFIDIAIPTEMKQRIAGTKHTEQ